MDHICQHSLIKNVIQWSKVEQLEGRDCMNSSSLTKLTAEKYRDATFAHVSSNSLYLMNLILQAQLQVCGLYRHKLPLQVSPSRKCLLYLSFFTVVYEHVVNN